jgi:hypothetical protein
MPRVRLLLRAAAVAAALTCGSRAAAQTWNTPEALQLAARAIQRRARTAGDTTLRDYRAMAHGFVFFLGQLGDDLSGPPRLIKADQLELEVYWKAPGLSKQRIIGWRDRADLPTDIHYHIDHLGIVQNNFGPVIRLGEGDEVRDVPHPLGPIGLERYEFALGDTIALRLPDRAVRVAELRVRPRDFSQPGLVGSLFVDLADAELVRLVFSFTPSTYVDRQLEDLSIVLDNALIERYWLPYRQEIEIRRRATWLDLPARGIIRGRWEIGGYELNLGLAERWFRGPEIVALPRPVRDSFPWSASLETALRDVAGPVPRADLEAVRLQVIRVAGGRAITTRRPPGLAARALSDLVHVNRVEGLVLGGGVSARPHDDWEVRALAGFGLADERVKGRLDIGPARGHAGPWLEAFREIRDVSDWPVGSRLVNSFSAQELGRDYGDYYLAQGARVGYRQPLGVRWEIGASVGWEQVDGVAVRATPASGRHRANADLGAGGVRRAQLRLRRTSSGFALRRDVALDVTAEIGRADGGTAAFGRVAAAGQVLVPAGGTHVLVRAAGGAGGASLPAYRSFVLGGRGTLLGDEFRAWGGRHAALAHVEWRVPVTVPTVPLGPFARTPGRVTLAPFAAVGGAAGALPDGPPVPWRPVAGARVTLGLGVEWLGILRCDAGYGVLGRRVRFGCDVTRDFWDIL